MSKTYTIADSAAAEEQKTITISETKSVTEDKKTTIAQLKEKHKSLMATIADLGGQADQVVDELAAIESNLGVTVAAKPAKVVDATASVPVIHKKQP